MCSFWVSRPGILAKSGRLGTIWDQLDDLNLEGKIVALYGLGDQLGYGEWFLDALGMLHDKLSTKGVKFVGYWPTEGYEFTSPKPVIADGQLFVGLALDETNQYDLSDERIQSCVSRSSTKWQSITPDVTDGLAHMLCRHLYLCVSCCNNIRRKSRHSASSMLSAASHKCCRLPPSERKRSIMPLLIIHGALTMLHSCPLPTQTPVHQQANFPLASINTPLAANAIKHHQRK